MTRELRTFIRFVAVGFLNTAFGYGCYAALILMGSPLWLAVGGSWVLGVSFNFMSYGHLVFGGAAGARLPRFILFYFALACLNVMLLRSLIWIGANPLLGQATLLPLLAVTSYLGMKGFVFQAAAIEKNEPSHEH